MEFLNDYPMEGSWCIAPEVQRGESRYRYDFGYPYKRYLTYTGEKLGRDLSWVTPHVMRHTFASLLVIAGVSLYKVSKWLGDDDRVAQRHYAHLQEGDREINKLRNHATIH